jgi:hypothetical protein
MDIHKPKAAHSLREFVIEIGTIICGILIALSLEQGLELAHERKISVEARDAVRAEVQENLWWLDIRQQDEPCVRQHLQEMGDLLAKARQGQPFPVAQHLGLASHGKVTTARWEANAQAGRASLFPPDEQRTFGNIYFTSNQFRQAMEAEENIWSKLGAIEGLDHLTPVEIHDFSMLLAQARYEDWLVRLSMSRAHQWASRLHLSAANQGAIDPRRSSAPKLCRSIAAKRDDPSRDWQP